jgi:3-hydroxybutyryl-CoA dehydratase
LEHLPYGVESRSQSHTLSESDLVVLHNLLGATDPIHTDAEFAAKTIFGRPIAAGPIVASLVAIDWAHSDLNRALQEEHGLIALAGLSMTVDYKSPVVGGDTVSGVYRLEAARPSASRPGHYILTIAIRGENQHGASVLVGTMTTLYQARDA